MWYLCVHVYVNTCTLVCAEQKSKLDIFHNNSTLDVSHNHRLCQLS